MINVGSDFSGVGAFDQSLRKLDIDYNTVYACDWDKYARQTYIDNYGTPDYFPEDVYNRKIPKQSLDIYMSSPPCQTFSIAGKRKGQNDDRGILFYNTHEFIQQNKPRYFIIENVKGLLSDDNGRTFKIWLEFLGGKSVNGNSTMFPADNATPYHVYYKVLNAKHYGVPQNRERVFIVGIRDDADNVFSFPKPVFLYKRLKDVLENDVDDKYFLSDKMIAGFVNTGKDKGFINQKTQSSVIHSKNEEVPAIQAGTHGYVNGYIKVDTDNYLQVKSATKKGYEIATENDSINFSVPNSETRRGRVGKGVAQTLDTSCNQGVMIGAIRGRDSEFADSSTRQTLEVNKQGTSNTITSVQKDNVVLMSNYVQWDTSGKGYNSQSDRAFFEDGCMGTLAASSGGSKNNVLTNDYKIRKLTPRECFRLMSFPDTFTWTVSNSQAYKQAGNSIVVHVLAAIINKLKL